MWLEGLSDGDLRVVNYLSVQGQSGSGCSISPASLSFLHLLFLNFKFCLPSFLLAAHSRIVRVSLASFYPTLFQSSSLLFFFFFDPCFLRCHYFLSSFFVFAIFCICVSS